MSDPIDRDKLIDFIMESDPEWCVNPIRPIFDYIKSMPTADVVEVVRCKDCKHRNGSACDYSAVWVRENGFCQWGERREENDNG